MTCGSTCLDTGLEHIGRPGVYKLACAGPGPWRMRAAPAPVLEPLELGLQRAAHGTSPQLNHQLLQRRAIKTGWCSDEGSRVQILPLPLASYVALDSYASVPSLVKWGGGGSTQ